MEFVGWPKIARLRRDVVVTEKIDGTCSHILIESRDSKNYMEIDEVGAPWLSKDTQGFMVAAGSRTRWILPGKNDNYGFAGWVAEHIDELVTKLGPGHHFGEWWGAGVQRRYGLKEKRFSLFNTAQWNNENKPDCCHVVPVLYTGVFDTNAIKATLMNLEAFGSVAAPGFMKPEGVVIYHEASRQMFKQTIIADEKPKGSKE